MGRDGRPGPVEAGVWTGPVEPVEPGIRSGLMEQVVRDVRLVRVVPAAPGEWVVPPVPAASAAPAAPVGDRRGGPYTRLRPPVRGANGFHLDGIHAPDRPGRRAATPC
ncbi:hypothetical protein GCM10010305_47240 [Streptomyces termitum]|uniref:Uncharacterized protein n=1 Tax=Streptomyces termitum TaxID=67368 RepID=A0A918T6Q2_9ACTN|nr:hypothetical protein GCM10010305_47240 [Streptomyces termitum]